MLPRYELVQALLDAFSLAEFDMMLSNRLNWTREQIVAGTGTTGSEQIISAVVAYADKQFWALDLIGAAHNQVPGNPKLQDFLKNYPEWDPRQVAALGSPFLSIFMRGWRVFLKRDDFRAKLQQIGVFPNSRVMAIDGGRSTGKTYSLDFINFIRETKHGFAAAPIVCVDLDKCAFTPQELAWVVGKQVGLTLASMPPDSGEQDSRRIPNLIEWLTGGIQNSNAPPGVWWIVLDGFREMVHPQATHDLIRAMIDTTDRSWDKVRLILLNYGENLNQHIDLIEYVLKEEIEPEPIQRSDVETFFRFVYTKSGRAADAIVVKDSVDSVMTQVGQELVKNPTEPGLKILSVALTRAAKRLLA